MSNPLSLVRKNPIAAFFIFVVAIVFFVHAWNRNGHFQEYDSSLVYDSLYNFPRSQLSFNANTYPKGGIISQETARRIIEHPAIAGIVSPYYAKDFGEEQVVKKLSEAKPVALFRFAFVTALYKAHLPHAVNGFFALPLGSTYSAGAGLFYGLISGATTAYEDFMSRATLLTLFLFHIGALLIFFAALRLGVNRYAALLAGLWALFSVSLYSYGYHLGSTVWNFSTGALWLWFLIRDEKRENFLMRMSRLTGIFAFFNYLIVFYWGAFMVVRGYAEWKNGNGAREKIRKLAGLAKTQLCAIACFAAVAVLFYPPGQSGGGFFLGQLFHNLYFIVLNFFSAYVHSRPLNIVQFLAGCGVVALGFVSLVSRAKGARGTREDTVPKTLLAFFGLFAFGVAAGAFALVPSRHLLFLSPPLFVVAAIGVSRLFETWRERENALAALCGVALIAGIFGLHSRLADTRAVAAHISVPLDVAAIIIEDCGWNFIYGNFHPGIPAHHIEPGVLETGATYLYLSQARSFDEAVARWKRDYALDINFEKLDETATTTDAYFAAYNPDRLAHTRPNNMYTAKFIILNIAPEKTE